MIQPDPASVAAEVLVSAARSAFGNLAGPPVDVDAIAEELCGLRVEGADLAADAVSGLLLAGEQRLLFDQREAARSPGRRRFTIAHELGHWYLHHLAGERATQRCGPDEIGLAVTSSTRHEREANRFAGALLMPEPPLRAEAARLRCNVGVLARKFAVSEPAMRVRLTQLDLLPEYMR